MVAVIGRPQRLSLESVVGALRLSQIQLLDHIQRAAVDEIGRCVANGITQSAIHFTAQV